MRSTAAAASMLRRRPLPLLLLLLLGSVAAANAQHEDEQQRQRRRRLATGASEGYNFMFYFVIGAMMLTCLIYNIFFKHKMEAGFLRQHALPETMLRQDVIARWAPPLYHLRGGAYIYVVLC